MVAGKSAPSSSDANEALRDGIKRDNTAECVRLLQSNADPNFRDRRGAAASAAAAAAAAAEAGVAGTACGPANGPRPPTPPTPRPVAWQATAPFTWRACSTARWW